MNPRQILVIMDKPKHDQTALARALSLQARTKAHLHLASFAHHPMYDQKDVFETHQRRALKKEIIRQRSEWLRDQVRDAEGLFRDLSLEVVWTKDIAEWVADRESEPKADDLVVKSIHQSQTLVHTPLDWQLLRLCPKPVLLTSPRPWRRKPKVLATLDLRVENKAHETLNRKVLEAALAFAEWHEGEVHCVYAVDIGGPLNDLSITDVRGFRREAVQRSAERLAEITAPYGIPEKCLHVPAGKVGQTVNKQAARLRADLMVMGTTARKGLAARVIGNSAEKVLARAQCDVLALKP